MILEIANSDAPQTLDTLVNPVTRVFLERPLIPLSLKFWILFLYYKIRFNNQTAYVLALVRYLKVAAVVTFTDNYSFLGVVNSVIPTCRVVAIGIGFRTRDQYIQIKSILETVCEDHSQKLHDIYLCWGQRDVDLLNELGIAANLIIPIGSIRDHIFRASNPLFSEKIELLVSYHRIGLLSEEGVNPIEKSRKASASVLIKYLETYCADNNIKPVFLLRPGDQEYLNAQIQEIDKSYRGPWIPSSTEGKSPSYSTIAKSKVIVGIRSSILVEALGQHKKVLACNMTDDPNLDLFEESICQLTNPRYSDFSERLTHLRCMTEIEWFDAVDDLASRYISTDKRDVHLKLSNFLDMIVDNRIDAAIESLSSD